MQPNTTRAIKVINGSEFQPQDGEDVTGKAIESGGMQ